MTQAVAVFTHSLQTTQTVGEHRFVTSAGAPAGSGGHALGVASMDAASGEWLGIVVLGSAQIEAAGALSVGEAVESDTEGRAITHTNGVKLGRTLQAATAVGDLIEILLIPN